jgi:hypothetical protein
LIALAPRVADAKIVLCMLVEILGGNSIAARRRFACQGDVSLEYLMGAAADLDVRAAAVEGLIALRASRLLSERAVCVKAPARPLIWSRSHIIRDVGIGPASSFAGPTARLSTFLIGCGNNVRRASFRDRRSGECKMTQVGNTALIIESEMFGTVAR